MNFSENDYNIRINNAMRRIRTSNRYSYLESPRPDYGFLLLVQGRMDYIIEDQTLSLHPYDMLFLPKGSKYEVCMHTEEGTVEDLLVNFDIITDHAPKLLIKPFSVISNANKTPLLTIMENIISNFQNHDLKYILAKSYFYLCLYYFITYVNKNEDSELLEQAKILLTDPNDYSVEEIAKMLLISNSGLRSKFKKQAGISPVAFRLQKRLDEAKLLLSSTDFPINEIAQICHFYDTAYFYKVFHEHTGMTPKQYRKTNIST